MFSFAAISAIGRNLVSRAISRSLFMFLGSSAYLAHHGVRPVGGVRPDLRCPVADLGCLQPSWAFHGIGGIHLVQREVACHAVLVGLFQHIARAATDARNLQDLRHVLSVVDTVEVSLVLGGNIHLHHVYVWRMCAVRHLLSPPSYPSSRGSCCLA